jgi:hypothetical protein
MTPSETAGSKVEPQAITLSENDHKTTQIKLEKPQERIDEDGYPLYSPGPKILWFPFEFSPRRLWSGESSGYPC